MVAILSVRKIPSSMYAPSGNIKSWIALFVVISPVTHNEEILFKKYSQYFKVESPSIISLPILLSSIFFSSIFS